MAGPLGSPPTSASYDQATLDRLTPWIVTSPPRPTQSPYQPPFLHDQSEQPFIAFSYKRPSKKAQEPTVLQLTIAPIDVIYSQLCLLSLLDFLNAAWPAAGLDPLKVRAGVSLKEIVQEKLLGGQQQHQMARRQQRHSMQRTKVLQPYPLCCLLVLLNLHACRLSQAQPPCGSVDSTGCMPYQQHVTTQENQIAASNDVAARTTCSCHRARCCYFKYFPSLTHSVIHLLTHSFSHQSFGPATTLVKISSQHITAYSGKKLSPMWFWQVHSTWTCSLRWLFSFAMFGHC